MGTALVGLVALPVLTGLALLVAGRPVARVAAPAAIAAVTVTAVLSVLVALRRPAVSTPLLAGIDASLAVDGLSAVLVLTVSAVATAVTVFAAADPTVRDAPHRFFGLLLVFVGAMLLTVTATNLLTLLAGWEVMGAMSYALVAHRWTRPGPPASGAVAFLVTRTADVGLYVAAGAALAGGVGTLALAELTQVGAGWRDLLTAGLVVAALGKSAQLPFSFWLFRAMDGPSPVSALLHSATMVAAGGYLLLRVEPLLAASGRAALLVAWVGVVTAVLLGLAALAQTDLKQLLAASTCSQIGFIVLAAGVGATAGGTLQLVAHAATKSLLFLVAGIWLTALGTRQLAALRGAARRWPLVGLMFAVGALSLAGLPPLSIFFGKDAVLAAAAATSPALYAAGLAGVVVSAAYAAAALVAVLGRAPDDAREPDVPHQVSLLARVSPVPLALAAAALGTAAEPVRVALGASDEPVPTSAQVWASGAASAVVVLAVFLSARAGARGTAVLPPIVGAAARVGALRDRLGLERLATSGVAAPTMALARALSMFDERVVDRAVRGTAVTTRAAARVADTRLDAPLARAVDGIGAAGRALGRLARRPQTGQLHHYYAQAVGALAVLALFLVWVR